MPNKKILFLISLSLCSLVTVVSWVFITSEKAMAQKSQSLSKAPPVLVELSKQVEGAKPADWFKIIQAKLGAPTRVFDQFSGRADKISYWSVEDGELTCDMYEGVIFKSKSMNVDLTRGKPTSVGSGLIGKYEISSAPAPPYGNMTLMGALIVDFEHRYHFSQSTGDSYQKTLIQQAQNFLTLHPAGTVSFAYPKGITADTMLEDLPDDTKIVDLAFTADDGAKQSYSVLSTNRRFHFTGGDSDKFRLSATWPDRK